MRLKITIGFAALVLGAALTSVPAFAQRSANDGGAIVIVPNGERVRASPNNGGTVAVSPGGSHHHVHTRLLYNSVNPVPHQTRKPGLPAPSRH
jgi:hypothetical protein